MGESFEKIVAERENSTTNNPQVNKPFSNLEWENKTEMIELIYALSKSASDVDLLRACFGSIENSFAKSDVETVNLLLEKIDPSKVRQIAALAIARSSARARKYLPSWAEYIAKLKVHLTELGESVSHSMRGIVSENDPGTFTAKRSVL